MITKPWVVATDLVAGYGDQPILGPTSFTIHTGVTALLGRNGGGKTTLMRTLCGIIPPLGGQCTVMGEPVTAASPVRASVGYLGHQLALASGVTVAQNLDFWQAVASTYPGVNLMPLEELITQFDLASMLDRKVGTLSRGQQQRVDLARLAMTNPRFIVLDEPLTGLDPVYAAQIRDGISQWGSTCAVLYSTHSVPEALALATSLLIIQGATLHVVDRRYQPISEQQILDLLEGSHVR